VPEVHLPDVGEVVEDEETHPPATLPHATARRSRTLLKLALEVVLISGGVFLGLMGERWSEQAGHRELAETSLRRLRAEMASNRKAVASQADYHATIREELRTFLAADVASRSRVSVRMRGLGPVFFERGAWDLALSTGALAYIDPDLAFTLSQVYTTQAAYADVQRTIIQNTVYRPGFGGEGFESDARALVNYFGDTVLMDPKLLAQYDAALKAIDRDVGEASPSSNKPAD
jgi:hypothetical protein